MTTVTTADTVLVLRVCDARLRSHSGFQWPEAGPVAAPDWSPVAECGRGLHGWLWGQGDPGVANGVDDPESRWLVVEVAAGDVVDLQGKVKYPRGTVIHCGDRASAVARIQADPRGQLCMWGTATAGYGGTATAGYGGTATAGDGGTATAGYGGTATAGYGGTATAGYGGTATAGVVGEVRIRYWDGTRYRCAVGYVGEGGVEAGVRYRVRDGKLVRAD